ncbi:acyl-CoA dehydrogenase family protein [Chloroflexota bacterium]
MVVDFELTEQQKMLQGVVREVLRVEYPPERARRDDEERNFPADTYTKMAELGWIGLPFPEAYGGGGGDVLDACIIMEEIAQVAMALAELYLLAMGFGGVTLAHTGTEEQKQLYLRKLFSGEYKFSLAVTEAEGGTDILGSTRTTAVPEGDDFIINGSKMFITGAHIADYLITFARTSKVDTKKGEGFSIFLVPAKAPGVQINKLYTLGFRTPGTCEVFFDNVRIPASNLLGVKDKGWYDLTPTLNVERVALAACSVGLAQAALNMTLQYSKERMAFGKPIGQFQAIQHYLAYLSVEIEAARLLTYQAAWRLSQGLPAVNEVAKADMYAPEVAVKAVNIGMRIHGGASYLMEHDIQRLYRDTLVLTMVPISNQMILNRIAETELGLPKSY